MHNLDPYTTEDRQHFRMVLLLSLLSIGLLSCCSDVVSECLLCGHSLGRRRRKTGKLTTNTLVGRHTHFLPAFGSRRHLSKPSDAARGRTLPVGQARL